jgi:hypothetical protein
MSTEQQQRENVPSQPPRDGGERPKQQQQQPQIQQQPGTGIDPKKPVHPDVPPGLPGDMPG